MRRPTEFRFAVPPASVCADLSPTTGGITARPKEYEQRVIAFFDRALLGG
jgi:hypothetical protein